MARPALGRQGGDRTPAALKRVATLSPKIPEQTRLGLHTCHGSLGHRRFVDPKDPGVCVRLGDVGSGAAGRRVDFIHMPVPRNRDDGAYFAPLRDLRTGDAKIYLGVVHYADGVAGARRRAASARRYLLPAFGIATERGFARRPPDQDPDRLLALHTEIADALGLSGTATG